MASSSAGAPPPGDDPTKRRSVVIVDMPVEFINRDVLKNHFDKYGTVERVACSVSKKYAVIHFSTPEEARNAEINGTIIKEGEPPLKIFNRAMNLGNISQRALASPPPPTPNRIVTRRKIVRNFGSGTGGVTVSLSSQGASASPGGGAFRQAPSLSQGSEAESPSQPIASTSRFQQAPLRSSIKISRPSPYLRRKPSFGDKTGKLPVGGGITPRNPFALPPRSMLSLDRRKKAPDSSVSSPPVKSRVDFTDGKIKNPFASSSVGSGSSAPSSSMSFSSAGSKAFDDSAEIPLPDEDDDDQEEKEQEQVPQPKQPSTSKSVSFSFGEREEPQPSTSAQALASASATTVDQDESTEDAAFNEEEYEDDADKPAEAETDTQDTAEATTEEEEGEIMDDENEEDQGGEEDEPYESPLKRMQKAQATPTSTTSSAPAASSSSGTGSAFSFKLTPSKTPSTGGNAPSSTSFSAPFSFGDSQNAPKPFSLSKFTTTFGGTSGSSNIFAGSSTSSSSSAPVEQASSSNSMPSFPTKDKESFKVFGGSGFGGGGVFGTKDKSEKTITSAPASDPEKEKPKAAPFSIFSSASSSPGSSKATPSTTPTAEAKKTSSSIFSAPKLSSGLGSRSSSPFTPSSQVPDQKPGKGKKVLAASASTSSSSSAPTPKDGPNPLLLTFNPDTSEAQELFSKRANTAEEKYRILEARDKIIRARIPKTKVNVEFATKLIGTCPDMCPEKERYMRQFQRQLVSYEILPNGQDISVDHQKAVKAYSRSSADQEEPLPHELRPGPTLSYTMHYLLRYIVPFGDNPDENLSDWYNFLWDRTRSIRKDITQQQITDLTAVSLYEKCARFHIHCASRLCELDVHSFDPKLNDENLMKCIQSLEHLYEDLRRRQVNCPNEPEFRAYQIMMNLNEGDALYQAQQLPSWIMNSAQVQTALKLHHCIYTKNFVGFFKTVEGLPYMTSCILHRYFFQVRSLALRCFIKAHCTLPKYETAMPMSTLQRMLGYGEGAHSFSYLCDAHGIHCDMEENKVILKRKLFFLPEFPSIYRENHLIDSKLKTSVAEAVNGEPLPQINFAGKIPHSSFNENGQLIPGDVAGSFGADDGKENQQSSSSSFVPPEISTVGRSQTKPGFGLFGAGTSSPSSFSSFGASAFQKSQKDVAASAESKKEGQSKPQFGLFTSASASSPSSSFSFAASALQQQKPPQPRQSKPVKEIEALCKAATSKLIEEEVSKDVTQFSQDRLVEAKRKQEEAEKRKKLVDVAMSVAHEFLASILVEQTLNIVKEEGRTTLRRLQRVEQVSENWVGAIVEQSVRGDVVFLAQNELAMAKENQLRLVSALNRIFTRVRARFAFEKWVRFSRTKKMEREKEEERKREQLWNFPVINSYSLSTQQVFQAFCGRSQVQPSLYKVDILRKSPEQNEHPFSGTGVLQQRTKRKSGGPTGDEEASYSPQVPPKLPRLSGGHSMQSRKEGEEEELSPEEIQRIKDLWDFPVSDPYSRTNSQVLQAFCGSSPVQDSISISPKMNNFGGALATPSSSGTNNRMFYTGGNFDPEFQIRRPLFPPSNRQLGEEIRTLASEGVTSDLLKNIKGFLSKVKEETKSTSLQPYQEKVEQFKKICPPEVRGYLETLNSNQGLIGSQERDHNTNNMVLDLDEDIEEEEQRHLEWEENRARANRDLGISRLLSGVFLEEDILLSSIRNFAKEVKQEKAHSWNTDTFLNQIDVEFISS